jgi:hypothetical protein
MTGRSRDPVKIRLAPALEEPVSSIRIGPPEPLSVARDRLAADLEALPEPAKRIRGPKRRSSNLRVSPAANRCSPESGCSKFTNGLAESDVDIAPSAGVAAAFGRWWLGRLGAVSDDLVKRPAGEIRQLPLHSLDVFPQRVGR